MTGERFAGWRKPSPPYYVGLTELMIELSWLDIELTGEVVVDAPGPYFSFLSFLALLLQAAPTVTIAIVAAMPAVAVSRRFEKNDSMSLPPSRGTRVRARRRLPVGIPLKLLPEFCALTHLPFGWWAQ